MLGARNLFRLGGGQRCARHFSISLPRNVKSKPKPPKKQQKPQSTANAAQNIQPYEYFLINLLLLPNANIELRPKIPKYQLQIPKSGQQTPPAILAMKEMLNGKATPKPSSKPPVNPLLDSHRRVPLIGAGIMVFCIAGYLGYFATALSKTPSAAPSEPSAQPDVSVRYDKIARKFDTSVDFTELSMGMPEKRQNMVAKARGDVLEVSVGTGRNLDYFNWDFEGHNAVGKSVDGEAIKRGSVNSLTAIDISNEMLEVAKEKFIKKFPGMPQPRWIVGDASREIPPPPQHSTTTSSQNAADKKYDTIIQTMGLCSVKDPVALLRNLGNYVKEDSGRILLLEHGRGTWRWVNYLLDKTAVGHALEHGCWWNRDIQAIIEESGLEIVNAETWHAGTTWRVELRKPKHTTMDNSLQGQAETRNTQDEKKGWSLW